MSVPTTYELRKDGHSYVMGASNLSTTNIGMVFGVSGLASLYIASAKKGTPGLEAR